MWYRCSEVCQGFNEKKLYILIITDKEVTPFPREWLPIRSRMKTRLHADRFKWLHSQNKVDKKRRSCQIWVPNIPKSLNTVHWIILPRKKIVHTLLKNAEQASRDNRWFNQTIMAGSSGNIDQVVKLSQAISKTTTGVVEFFSGLNIFLAFTAFLGNVLILFALRQVTSIHPPTKLLFQCLAVTDLCVGFIVQPLFCVYFMLHVREMNVNSLYYIFKVGGSLTYILCGVSVLTSTAINVDRLLALMLGMRYKHVVTFSRIRYVVISFWFTGALFVALWVWRRDIGQKLSSTFIVLSLITSISSFVKIYLKLRQHQTQIQNNFPQGLLSELGNQLKIARYKKTVSSILWVQFALLVCYVPYGVLAGTKMRDSAVPKLATETLIFMNSFLNPVLYCWKIGEVRKKVKGIIRQLWCC